MLFCGHHGVKSINKKFSFAFIKRVNIAQPVPSAVIDFHVKNVGLVQGDFADVAVADAVYVVTRVGLKWTPTPLLRHSHHDAIAISGYIVGDGIIG